MSPYKLRLQIQVSLLVLSVDDGTVLSQIFEAQEWYYSIALLLIKTDNSDLSVYSFIPKYFTIWNLCKNYSKD